MQIGDTVRFLNTVGGGKITKIEGRIAYVEENGFETPVLTSEIVVVLPAGHEPAVKGAGLMFDQKAFDTGKIKDRPKPEPVAPPAPAEEDFPIEETAYGEALTLLLAFEPDNIKQLDTTTLNMVLVNDSNYFLTFNVLRRHDETHSWLSVYQGEAAPNEVVDLAKYTLATLPEVERIVFQAIAYKKGKPFMVKSPLNINRKLDLTKFHKLHCYRPGLYFDTPVIEIPLIAEPAKER